MCVDIDALVVGKCYKLESSDKYLGEFIKIMNTSAGAYETSKTAKFKNNGKYTFVGHSDDTNANKKNMFIEVPCQTSGGRRRSRKSRQKRRRTHKRR